MTENHNRIISGPRARFVQARIRAGIFALALKRFGNPFRAYRVLKEIRKRRARIFGSARVKRYIL